MMKMETDQNGNCAGCGMAYSFVFSCQFHKADCKYRGGQNGN